MVDAPLLFTYPEVKAVSERLTKEKGTEVTPTQVLYVALMETLVSQDYTC